MGLVELHLHEMPEKEIEAEKDDAWRSECDRKTTQNGNEMKRWHSKTRGKWYHGVEKKKKKKDGCSKAQSHSVP